jgi:hypothetical protein
MPQVTLRLPNSSGGGSLPKFVIDTELRDQIKAIGIGGRPAKLCAGIARVTAKYLWLAEAAHSAKRLDRRKERFSRLRRDLGRVTRVLEELQIGDEGDFDTALIERSLSHPLIEPDPIGKLDKFGRMVRDVDSVARAVDAACASARKEALASVQAGLDPMKVWRIWVREMSRVWVQHGLLISVRKDELRASSFVQLIHIVQSKFDRRYQQHTTNLAALSQAVWRALREGPNGRTNSRGGTTGSGHKKASA